MAHLRVAPGRLEELLGVLTDLVGETRREPGNLEYRAFTSTGPGADEVIVREAYVNETALAAHRTSEHYLEQVPRIISCLNGPLSAHRLEPIVVPIAGAGRAGASTTETDGQ